MVYANIKPHKERNFRVNVYGSDKEKSSYENVITKDPNRIAQIFLDLIVLGFPIEKAIKIFNERMLKHDWMGI